MDVVWMIQDFFSSTLHAKNLCRKCFGFFRAYHYLPAKIIDITTNNVLKFMSLLCKNWRDILRMFAANFFKVSHLHTVKLQAPSFNLFNKCRCFYIIPLETTLSIGGVRETLTLSSLLCRRIDFITWRRLFICCDDDAYCCFVCSKVIKLQHAFFF